MKKRGLVFVGIVGLLSAGLVGCNNSVETSNNEKVVESVKEVIDESLESDVEQEIIEAEDSQEIIDEEATEDEEIIEETNEEPNEEALEEPEDIINEEEKELDRSLINSTLPDDVEEALSKLETDYNKVYWGSRYSMFEDMPGVVVSVTPCKLYGVDYGLVIAITNLYDTDVSFAGSASALGSNDTVIGDAYIYNSCIGSGNTFIEVIDCGSDEMPDGRIHWEDVDLAEAIGTYVPWEADYSGKENSEDGTISIDYELYATYGTPCNGEIVYALLIDENGFVIGLSSDYATSIGENEKYAGSIEIAGDEDDFRLVKDVAMFANPIAE